MRFDFWWRHHSENDNTVYDESFDLTFPKVGRIAYESYSDVKTTQTT